MAFIYLSYPLILRCIKSIKLSVLVVFTGFVVLNITEKYGLISTDNDPLFVNDFYSIWVWSGYYIIGHLLCERTGIRFSRTPLIIFLSKITLIPLSLTIVIYERYITSSLQESVFAWLLLEYIQLLLLSLAIFVIFVNLKIRQTIVIHIVESISPAMVGVYIVHYSVFYFLASFYNYNIGGLKYAFLVLVFLLSVAICRLLLINRFTARLITF